jgi:hypothetical protein
MRVRVVRLLGVMLLSGCGGARVAGSSSVGISATSASLSPTGALGGDGPRCRGAVCACRPLDESGRGTRGRSEDEEEGVAPGRKRLELRSGYGLDPVEWTIEGRGITRKSPESPEPLCSYVDLAPGKYRIKYRIRAADARAGLHPTLTIAEHGPAAKDWYDTFRYKCGSSGPCTEGEMNAWQRAMAAVPRGIHDPCGSVRVRELSWGSDRASGEHLEALELAMTLEVYPFETRHRRGAAACGQAARRERSASEDGETSDRGTQP